jgi:serine/threonine protein kinase
MKTQVDVKSLGHTSILEEELFKGENYMFRVSNEGKSYIVSGHKFDIGEFKQEEFANIMTIIKKIHKRYFISEVVSTLSCNFAKPLGIDYKLDDSLFIEILFECKGEVLNNVRGVLAIYNLMRQSASALVLLHTLRFDNPNLLLSNMRYDKSNDILKILRVEKIEESNKEAEILAPPEIIQKKEQDNKAADVYYWAMIFYSLLLNKDDATPRNEVNLFKVGEKDKYEGFLEFMKENIEKLNAKTKIKEIIAWILKRCLAFDPKERPKISTIIEEMKEFEQQEKIHTKYSVIDKELSKKIENALSAIEVKETNKEELKGLEEEVKEQLKQRSLVVEQVKKARNEPDLRFPINEDNDSRLYKAQFDTSSFNLSSKGLR